MQSVCGATRSAILVGLIFGALSEVSRADELKLKSTLKGHPGLVSHVEFAPDGATVVSSSAWSAKGNNPDSVIAWSVADGKKKKALPLEQSITLFGLLSEGKQAAIGRSEYVGLFDLKTGKEAAKLPGPGKVGVVCATASDKGNVVAAGFEKNEVVVWTVPAKGKKATSKVLKGHTKPAIRVAFSPDGKQLVSGSQDYSARIWDVSTGKELHVLLPENSRSPVFSVKYSHNGKLIATSGSKLCFWDPETGEEKEVFPDEPPIGVRALAFSPDDSLLATTTFDRQDNKKGQIEVWDLESGEKLAEATDPDGLAHAVAFSPDGKLIASGGGDTVKLWTLVREK